MTIDEICQKVTGEISALRAEFKSEVGHIKESVSTLTDEVRAIKEHRYENGLDRGAMKHDVDYLKTTVERHIENHINRDDTKNQRNWQMWFLIISIIIGGLAGWIFYILRG